MGFSGRLLAGLILLLFFLSCKKSPDFIARSGDRHAKDEPDQKMEKLHLQSYGPEGLEWELTAPQGKVFSDDGQTVVNDLTVTLYRQSQKSTLVTADQGFMVSADRTAPRSSNRLNDLPVELEAGDMFLNGHVVLVSTEGHTITTDWAHYKKKYDLIVSTAPVEVIRDDSITRGAGMEANSNLSHIKIFNEVLIVIDEKERSPN